MKITFLFLIMVMSQSLCAQYTKTMELKPIQAQGWKYFYDFKRVNSAFALQIPLQALEDEEINNRYRRFNTFQTIRGIAYFAPVLYLFTGNLQTSSGETQFLLLTAAAVVTDLTFTILSHSQMKKAVGRYNELILKHTQVGFQWERLPHQKLMGLSLRYRLQGSQHHF